MSKFTDDDDDMSSIGFSQDVFDKDGNLKPAPEFILNENDQFAIDAHTGKIISINGSDSYFVDVVNAETRLFEEEIENHSAASELLTGIAQVPEPAQIQESIAKYVENIETIAAGIVEPPSISAASSISSRSSAQSVLSTIISKSAIEKRIETVINRKREKYTIGVEMIDFTWAKTVWKLDSVADILANNNRFAILKFACANGIHINKQHYKLYYFQKELEWMLEQDSAAISAKGSTRQLRKLTLDACATNPSALELFDKVYSKMCYAGKGFKVCAVGGNVLRAYFLALKSTIETPKTATSKLESFAKTLPYLDTLCKKSSDADFTGFETMNAKDGKKYAPIIEEALNRLCETPSAMCAGTIEFPLVRLKIRIHADERSFPCIVRNKMEILKLANAVFPEIKWFPQMIPDNDVSILDKKKEKLDADTYREICNLYCVMQRNKIYNSLLTSNVADIIATSKVDKKLSPSKNTYNNIMKFVQDCCEEFVEEIEKANIKVNVSSDINAIVAKITPAANAALANILESKKKSAIIKTIIEKICDPAELSQKGIIVATDENGNYMWSKSTSISVGNTNEEISKVQKASSLIGRQTLNKIGGGILSKNLCITTNTLQFAESLKSLDDMKDAEQPQTEELGGGGGGGVKKLGGRKTRKHKRTNRKTRRIYRRC